MTIYIDSDYKCHTANDGTMREFDVPFFDGKCAEFVERYRYVPDSETWTRVDGQTFTGEMIAPWKDYTQLANVQAAVDRTQTQADEEIAALIEEIYINDMEVIENV